jgi:ribonuclease Z
VTISGDTSKSAALTNAAKRSDMLVAELLNPALVQRMERAARTANRPDRAKIFADIPGYHLSPADAGASARAAGAKALAFTHIVPAVPNFVAGRLTDGAATAFGGPITVAADGDVRSIAPDGKQSWSRRL